jgi:hypothetical protein
MKYYVDRCLSFCPFSFGHCVVCPSSAINGIWLPPFGIFKLFLILVEWLTINVYTFFSLCFCHREFISINPTTTAQVKIIGFYIKKSLELRTEVSLFFHDKLRYLVYIHFFFFSGHKHVWMFIWQYNYYYYLWPF